MEEPNKLFVGPAKEELETAEHSLGEDAKEKALEFLKAFLSMKIESVHAIDEKPLELEFHRRPVRKMTKGSKDGDDEKWEIAA